MVNPDVLHRRLKKLDEYLGYLDDAQRYSYREFADDPEHRGSVERFLHLAIEALTDMASHVVADDDLGTWSARGICRPCSQSTNTWMRNWRTFGRR